MSNRYYNQLKDLVGDPVKTERQHMGLSAARFDYFSCGCTRVYIARMMGDHAEDEEKLYPCTEHGRLVEAPTPAAPQREDITQPKLF